MSLDQSFQEILMEDIESENKTPPHSPLVVPMPQIELKSVQSVEAKEGKTGKEAIINCLTEEKEKIEQLNRELVTQTRQKEETPPELQTEQLLLNENEVKEQVIKSKESDPVQLECEVSYVYASKIPKEELKDSDEFLRDEKHQQFQKIQAQSEAKLNEKKKELKFMLACQRHNREIFSLDQKKNQKAYRDEDEPEDKKVQPQQIQEQYQIPTMTEQKKKDFLIACQRFTSKQMRLNRVSSQKKYNQQKVENKDFDKEDEIFPESPAFQDFFLKCKFDKNNCICPQGVKATMICVQKKCEKSAYICSDEGCDTCKENHKDCFLKITVQMFAEALNRNLKRQKCMAREIFEIQEAVLSYVAESRKKLLKYLCLQGADSSLLSNWLQQEEKNDNVNLKSSQILNLIDAFNKDEYYDENRLCSVKPKLREDKKTIQSVLKREVRLVMEPFDPFEHVVLPSRLVMTAAETQFIAQSLEYPKEFKLVYRASQHEFNLQKFHQVCDNLENTLTIIKTEHDKLIGGFTPLKWNNKHGRDRSNKSFMMAINVKEKLEPIRLGECAIHYDDNLGPCFGGLFDQRDLEIFKDNGLLCCTTNFPNSYNWKKQFKPCQQSRRFLTGVEEGKKCQVMDFEVFKVVYSK